MFFWKNCGIGVHEVDKINANQYINISKQNLRLRVNGGFVSHDLSQSCCFFFFLKYFSVMEHNRLTKVTLVSFPQKPSFKAIVQFRPKAAEILHP